MGKATTQLMYLLKKICRGAPEREIVPWVTMDQPRFEALEKYVMAPTRRAMLRR